MATVLVVSAHPDDETMAAGGTIAMYAARGDDVYVLETTHGEGGEVGEPPLVEREDLGRYREGEVRRAVAALGVKDIFFLPYIDPHMEIGGTAQAVDASPEEFSAAIQAYLERLQPQIVLTHGSNGEYGHPQHIFTHTAVRQALADAGSQAELWTWGAWYEEAERPDMMNKDDQADEVRDITPWFEQKVAAAMCHRTQHAMFLRNSGSSSIEAMVPRVESWKRVQ